MVEKLWGGRFEASLDKQTEEFGASIKFEQRLAPFDLKGSYGILSSSRNWSTSW